MYRSGIFYLLLAVSCCLAALSDVDHARVRRRVKPRPKKPLTLEELSVQCQQHSWFKCREKTRELLSAVSNTSIEYRRCITSAVLERVSPVSVDPLQIAADAPAVPGAGDEAVATAAGNNQSPQTHEDPSVSCTLDGQAKEIAREHYCNILSISSATFVHNYMDNDVAHLGLTGLAHCGVNYYQSDEIFTPDELLTSLKAWYTRTVQRHDCCNDYLGFTSLGDKVDVYTNCPTIQQATVKWDWMLSKVAVLMKKVELLEGLGRRKQCLRGCVGLEEVQCCDQIV